MSAEVALALGGALVIGVVVGGGLRWLLGSRTHLSWSASVLSGILGAFLGSLAATGVNAALGRPFDGRYPFAVVLAGIAGTLLVMLVATRLTRRPDPTPEELIAGGEAADVEFKSTARLNTHTGQRDEKMELVIAKTVAAFANSAGGRLVIGVADDGEILGLDGDLQFMKQRDVDRYELWLRDYLSQTLGGAVTSSLAVTFPRLSGREICLVTVPASPRPVFVVPRKGEGPQLWVRVGNSTRQLPLDEALVYASDRFGRRGLRRA
ncbi:MAG: ATP-binding protein [Candidatus Nanopelagicales bacterium]